VARALVVIQAVTQTIANLEVRHATPFSLAALFAGSALVEARALVRRHDLGFRSLWAAASV
jgi:hypothetical protein